MSNCFICDTKQDTKLFGVTQIYLCKEHYEAQPEDSKD